MVKFLLSTSTYVPGSRLLITPGKNKSAKIGVVRGQQFAIDNGAFGGFDEQRFLSTIRIYEPYRSNCLFVVVPDIVGDAVSTLQLFDDWCHRLSGWSLAYVAQDGAEDLPIPADCSTVFIGGSTEWKESMAAVSVIKRAQSIGKRIHIGRVNWGRRYRLFVVLAGSEHFTCDGTRQRFDGLENTLSDWRHYEAQKPLISI